MFPTDSPFLWHHYFLNRTASVFLHKRCCACRTSSPHTAPHHTITLKIMCYGYNTKNGKLYLTCDKQIGSPQDRTPICQGTFQLLLQSPVLTVFNKPFSGFQFDFSYLVHLLSAGIHVSYTVSFLQMSRQYLQGDFNKSSYIYTVGNCSFCADST